MDPNMQSLINEYKKYLQPVQPLDQQMSYDQFAEPFKQYATQVGESYKPWFEYFTAQPFKQDLANQMAAGNAQGSGSAFNVAQRSLREMYQPLNSAITSAGEQVRSGMITPLYNQRINQYYSSPARGFNYQV